jgi:hypothetical protein
MSVHAELCGLEQDGERTLAAQLWNLGSDPVPNVGVYFEWDNEQAQPSRDGTLCAGGGA